MSVKDALQLMLAFGTFTTELIKISKKNNRHCSKLDGYL
ncbi:putative holin-like toxin [Lactobacillus mellis]|nr:putative holin-like toxin [Bombilactobacillus mellis]NUF98167.1 putative holin-like toxin [Bombilactobacillus mellis]